jgi:predicted Zn-ribbon and HTH transcriptional regulator
MSNRRPLIKNHGRIVGTIILILLGIFAISSIVIFSISRSEQDIISHNPGSHTYTAGEIFSHFQIKVTEYTNKFYNNGESPLTNPFYRISSAEITVYDSTDNEIDLEILLSGKVSYSCYTSTVTIVISEPTYCYQYEIEVIEHKFDPINPILFTLAGIVALGCVFSFLYTKFIWKDDSTQSETNNSLPNRTRKIKKAKNEKRYLYEIVMRLPKKRICGISRTLIEPEDEALRCPYCRSYFIRQYLVAWLQEKEHCPVCFRPLVEEE